MIIVFDDVMAAQEVRIADEFHEFRNARCMEFFSGHYGSGIHNFAFPVNFQIDKCYIVIHRLLSCFEDKYNE